MKNNKKGAISKKIIIAVAAMFVAVVGLGLVHVQWVMPYAIIVDGQEVAYVNDKMSVSELKKAIVEDYKADESEVLKYDFNKDIKLEQKNVTDGIKKDQILTKKQAVKFIEDVNENKDTTVFKATVVGQTEGVEEYTPETVYVKEENMFAGETVIEVEEKSGTQNVTRQITTVNGEETKNEVTDTEIIEEGTAAVIHKGTLGLPEGEDWKTYEGDPEFSGADDVIALAKKYQGLRYIYGGFNLNKGVDCVGFVHEIYEKYGINLPTTHKGIRKSGYGVSYKNMKPGDILCYSRHMAIYIGNGKIIHATSNKGVHVSKVYHGQKLVTIRRLVK